MNNFAVYIHQHHAVVHKIGCCEIEKRDKGDVTREGFWVKCDSSQAVKKLIEVLEEARYTPGTSEDAWCCNRCHPNIGL